MEDGLVVQVGGIGDLSWQVVVTGDTSDLLTMLHVHRAGVRVVDSGFRGPPLYPGKLLNEWRGRSGRLPYFVMVRTASTVTSVIAVTDQGTEVEVPLSDAIADFGLRFGAAALPPGEAPAGLRHRTAAGDLPELRAAPVFRPWK